MQKIRTFVAAYVSPLSAATIGVVVLILLVCVLLWEVTWLRPYLAAFGAGAAAFLGPLSGIISPGARTKWLSSILVAALIGVFTWFATSDLSERLDTAERAQHASEARNASYLHAFETVLRQSNGEAQDAFIMTAGRICRQLYRSRQPQAELDLALLVLSVRPNNGHGLYFAAEAHRALGDAGNAIGRLQNYIAEVDHQPDAFVGDAEVCYAGSNGFCAERTGWVLHLIADHFVKQTASLDSGTRQHVLWEAFRQEERNLELVKWQRPQEQDELSDLGQPFRLQETVLSSCQILRAVERDLAELGGNAADVRAARLRLLAHSCPDLNPVRAEARGATALPK